MWFPWSKADKDQEDICLRELASVPFHALAFPFPKKEFEDPNIGLAYVYWKTI